MRIEALKRTSGSFLYKFGLYTVMCAQAIMINISINKKLLKWEYPCKMLHIITEGREDKIKSLMESNQKMKVWLLCRFPFVWSDHALSIFPQWGDIRDSHSLNTCLQLLHPLLFGEVSESSSPQTNNHRQQIRNFDVVNTSSNFWRFEYPAEFVDDKVNHTTQIWFIT